MNYNFVVSMRKSSFSKIGVRAVFGRVSSWLLMYTAENVLVFVKGVRVVGVRLMCGSCVYVCERQ